MILFDKNKCISICVRNKNKYVLKAMKDLICDFKRISEYCVFPEVITEEIENCIVIEENTKEATDPVSDESFTIRMQNGKIIISAST